MKKIAILSFYSGILPRGVEVFVHDLANRLVGLGDDVTVFQTGEVLPWSKYKTQVVPILSMSSGQGRIFLILNQIYDFVSGGLFTIKVLSRMPKDIDIVIPTNNRLQAIFVKIWSLFHHVKIVISGHGGPGLDERIALWTFPDVFVALSSVQENWAKRTNPFIKTTVIPNGIDLSQFSSRQAGSYVGLKKPIVLCVGAMWPMQKRQDLLIKAMSKVPNASLLLVGDGEEREAIEELGNKLLPGRFQIIQAPHDAIPGIYRSCDLFVYPTSPWESFGIVLLEAMASGLGVVATDDPIRREILQDAGIYADPTNENLFAEKIKEGLSRKWGKIPRTQAEKFSWDIISKKYHDLCGEL